MSPRRLHFSTLPLHDMGYRSSRVVALARISALLLVLAFVPPLFAQAGGGGRDEARPLLRFVPASANFCVVARKLTDVDAAFRRTRAWRFLPALIGATPVGEGPFDLRKRVAELFSLDDPQVADELVRSEIALIAQSWSQLGDAVWLVRVPDEAVLDRWFPPDQRLSGGSFRSVRLFRTRDGVLVCARNGVAAMSRTWGSGTLLDQTMALMAGGANASLDASQPFQNLLAHLPQHYLALLYAAPSGGAGAGGVLGQLWWPTIERAAVGLYEGDGRIDVAVRASMSSPQARRAPLGGGTINRLMKLPHTTLYASATTLAPDAASTLAGSDGGAFAKYMAFITGVQTLVDGPASQWPKLGPNATFIWGQDLRADRFTPQVAVMVQCAEQRLVYVKLRRLVNALIGFLVHQDESVSRDVLEIRRSRYLGVPISSVSLVSYAEASSLPVAQLVKHVEPAWAVWNDWLIVALSRDHLERILDAQLGMAPTLATVPDVRALQRWTLDRSAVSIIQPGIATKVLSQWLDAHGSGQPSLLDTSWWQGVLPQGKSMPFGITTSDTDVPGAVVVAETDETLATTGELRRGDIILAVDGELLPMAGAADVLRDRLTTPTHDASTVLRVMRDGRVVELNLALNADQSFSTRLAMRPADAVAELVSLGKTLQFVSFAVDATSATGYSARLSLRFANSPASRSNAGNN